MISCGKSSGPIITFILQRGFLSEADCSNPAVTPGKTFYYYDAETGLRQTRQTKYVNRIESGEASKQQEQGLALQAGRQLGGDDEMGMTRLWRQVRYKTEGLIVSTSGLIKKGQSEISISVDSADLLTEAERFLRFVVDYLDRTKVKILPNQTMNYGYWLVKFEPTGHEALDVWEYDPELDHFLNGGSLTLRYWRDQQAVCETFQAAFDPPNPGKLTSISDGVMEGRAVQAVRYNFGDPMSGWLIVTDQYDGNIKSLINHHTYHVTASRPDLAKFLAGC